LSDDQRANVDEPGSRAGGLPSAASTGAFVLGLPIRAYRRWISPFKPPMCRFAPTCSQYALEALHVHGLFKGGALALWRVCRCHPFSEPGPDPVPPRRDSASQR
jgi:hypothetical protein